MRGLLRWPTSPRWNGCLAKSGACATWLMRIWAAGLVFGQSAVFRRIDAKDPMAIWCATAVPTRCAFVLLVEVTSQR